MSRAPIATKRSRKRQRLGGSPDWIPIARRVVDYLNSLPVDSSVRAFAEGKILVDDYSEGIKGHGYLDRDRKIAVVGPKHQRFVARQEDHPPPRPLTASEIEELKRWEGELFEIVQAFRRVALADRRKSRDMWEEMLRWVLPFLGGMITIGGRRVMPPVKRCPGPGCPKLYLAEHGKKACSTRCGATVRDERRRAKLKQAGLYEAYKKLKRRRAKNRRKEQRRQRSSRP